jgi:glutaredoxin 3
MLVLYYRPTCPYCKKVLAAAKELGVGLEVRDIGDAVHAKELVESGGKQQVPYLVDRKYNVSMYESDDIIEYLKHRPGA